MLPAIASQILRQYAAATGVYNLVPTLHGVRGAIRHNDEIIDVALVLVDSGAIELRCLSGPDLGQVYEVATMRELREGMPS